MLGGTDCIGAGNRLARRWATDAPLPLRLRATARVAPTEAYLAVRRGGALPLPRATARVAPTEGYKQYRERADVGSELSAAGGRRSEVSEWPRSKF